MCVGGGGGGARASGGHWQVEVAIPVPLPHLPPGFVRLCQQHGVNMGLSLSRVLSMVSEGGLRDVPSADLGVWEVPPGSRVPCVAGRAAWGHQCVLGAWEVGAGCRLR